MSDLRQARFDPAIFLAQAGLGRRIVQLKAKRAFFSQGDPADCVFYLQSGRAKLTVISETVSYTHLIAVAVAMRSPGVCAIDSSPTKSPADSSAMVASLPVSDITVSFARPLCR